MKFSFLTACRLFAGLWLCTNTASICAATPAELDAQLAIDSQDEFSLITSVDDRNNTAERKIPEPSTNLLIGATLLGVVLLRKHRRLFS